MSQIIEAWDEADFESIAKLTLSRFKRKDVRMAIRESRFALKMLELAKKYELTAAEPHLTSRPLRVVSILHSSLPSHTGGYTGRAQGLLKGLTNVGVEIRPYTRPGFYSERVDKTAEFPYPMQQVDGVTYRHLPSDVKRSQGEYEYMYKAIKWYRRAIMAERPDVVHLRSTHLSALPAMIAAHSLNIPTVYEVSGLWELVYEGRGQLGRANRARRLEDAVCALSDKVVTMNYSMANLLNERAGSDLHIGMVPNAVDISRFASTPNLDEARPFEFDLGYVGSLVDYEGLGTLIEAMAVIREKSGREIRTKIVGNGNELPKLKDLAKTFGVEDNVYFPGRVSSDEAVRQYDDVNIVVLPRLSTPATEVVTPLKPFEAMAAGRPLILSDVSALQEVSEDGKCALVFRSGDAGDLAEKIIQLLDDQEKKRTMVKAAKEKVDNDHNWDRVALAFKRELEAVRRPKEHLPFIKKDQSWQQVGHLLIGEGQY